MGVRGLGMRVLGMGVLRMGFEVCERSWEFGVRFSLLDRIGIFD